MQNWFNVHKSNKINIILHIKRKKDIKIPDHLNRGRNYGFQHSLDKLEMKQILQSDNKHQ